MVVSIIDGEMLKFKRGSYHPWQDLEGKILREEELSLVVGQIDDQVHIETALRAIELNKAGRS